MSVDGAADESPVSSVGRLRGVLRVRDFRWLWISLALSSFGDWLGLLAKTAMATELASSYQEANFALGGVLLTQLLPSLLLGPLAGVVADRFDRRVVMVGCDIMRFGLFITLPILHSLPWLFIASFLIECFSLFWRPAKEASVPNLLHRKEQLESANQLSLITTYGVTPVAAAVVFSWLAWFSRQIGESIHYFARWPDDLAMYANAATFVVAAATVARLRVISTRQDRTSGTAAPGTLRLIREGVRFIGGNRLIRGLLIGIVGAFAAGGAVIGTGKIYARSLGGGDAAYGLLFGAVFVGLGCGMAFGPRLARQLSRQRAFGLSIVVAGGALVLTAVMPHLALAVLTVGAVGFFAGIAYLAGMTLIGNEVDDEVRGRTFAFVQSMVQVVLIASLAVVPFLVGAIQQQRVSVAGHAATIDGSRFILAAAGLLASAAGVVAYRLLDDTSTIPLVRDVVSAVRGDSTTRRHFQAGGVFIAFEGGEGTGKTTQLRALAVELRLRDIEVVETFEPGATPLGAHLRQLLLHTDSAAPSPRSEVLLFAADRAHHVDTVFRPALAAGKVVLTDRYVDSSLAYQGAGRSFPLDEVRRISNWATDELRPDLTVLLDADPALTLQRLSARSAVDRLERESLEFHRRVRQAFRDLAEASPERYLVCDAGAPREQLAEAIRDAVLALLPPDPGPATPATVRRQEQVL